MEVQMQSFKVARYRVRKRVEPGNVGQLAWNTSADRSDGMEVWSSSVLGKEGGGDTPKLARWDGVRAVGIGFLGPRVGGNDGSHVSFPSLSFQAPSFPPLSVRVPPKGPSFDRNCFRRKALEGIRDDRH